MKHTITILIALCAMLINTPAVEKRSVAPSVAIDINDVDAVLSQNSVRSMTVSQDGVDAAIDQLESQISFKENKATRSADEEKLLLAIKAGVQSLKSGQPGVITMAQVLNDSAKRASRDITSVSTPMEMKEAAAKVAASLRVGAAAVLGKLEVKGGSVVVNTPQVQINPPAASAPKPVEKSAPVQVNPPAVVPVEKPIERPSPAIKKVKREEV